MAGLSTFDAFKHLDNPDFAVELSGDRLIHLQRVLRMMLRDFDRACSFLGVSYTLSGGSCLGAVRHKGFIPWDDDLDINMMRDDLHRLAEGFESVLGDRYVLYMPGEVEGYDLGFARIRLKGTVLRNRDDWDLRECGVYVDIFILDSAPDNSLLRRIHGTISLALGFAYSCRRFFEHGCQYLSLAEGNNAATAIFKKKMMLGRLFAFKSVEGWVRVWDRWNGMVSNGSSTYVTIPTGRKHYFGELYRRDDFFPVSHGEFEGLDVPLPADPTPYLEALYGSEYMTLPPESDRERHIVYEFDLGPYSEE